MNLGDDGTMAAPKLDLEHTLNALYDTKINVTISTLWDGGMDFESFHNRHEAAALWTEPKRS
jgi:hypothetical protein